MSDQLTTKLIEWVETLSLYASEELPTFVTEVVRYGIVRNAVSAFFSAIAISVLCYLFYYFYTVWCAAEALKPSDERFWRNPYDGLPMLGVFPGFILVGLSIYFVECLGCLIKAWLAPKLFVIDLIR